VKGLTCFLGPWGKFCLSVPIQIVGSFSLIFKVFKIDFFENFFLFWLVDLVFWSFVYDFGSSQRTPPNSAHTNFWICFTWNICFMLSCNAVNSKSSCGYATHKQYFKKWTCDTFFMLIETKSAFRRLKEIDDIIFFT
jgi:hypothetical protein